MHRFLFSSSSSSSPAMSTTLPKIKAVNLGGWLVADGSIKPSLFDGIPNKDFLDGTKINLKSVTQKFINSVDGGGATIVASGPRPSYWEIFRIWRVDADHFQLLAVNGRHFVGLENGGAGVTVVATATSPGEPETFQIVRNPSNPNRVRIKSSNGLYWRANSANSVTSEAQGNGDWSDGDPSVFILTILYDEQLKGEYQVTNGYGSQASTIMKEHWKTFIEESDFHDIKKKGLNAVRIPVGWWIASDPNPPEPFVSGSLAALDDAFKWAEKYGLGVIIDLHAPPDGGSRDGVQAWGDGSIPRTVVVIDFLARRYAGNSALLGIELLNEPRGPGVTPTSLTSYYRAGYDAVRRYTSTAYVIMSNRLDAEDPKELLPFMSGLSRCVLDVHYYNLFTPEFDNMSVQQNIDYIYSTRAGNLNDITIANGPLVLVGEWVAEWNVPGATKAAYQAFAASQLDVFGRQSFGWAYWTWKSANRHWSLQWMIDNGYINLLEDE